MSDPSRNRAAFLALASLECEELPLYHALCTGIAADDALVALLDRARGGQSRPVLLLAALHELVLRHPDAALSRLYPTVGGSFDPSVDPMPLVRSFIADHDAELGTLLAQRATQTNEVNRSCLWFAAVRHAAADRPDRPIAMVEIGASAGLNLAFDRYRYTYTFANAPAQRFGSSQVHLACEIRSGEPPLTAPLPVIAARIGLDRDRVDLDRVEDRSWLKACLWAEQSERHERFDAAVRLARADPPVVVVDDAVDGISDVIESAPGDAHVVIVSSWVQAYLRRDRRKALDAAIDLAGGGRDISWISAEGAGTVEWVPASPVVPEEHTVVGLARWRDGVRDNSLIARCQPHLAWLDWLAP